MDPVSRLIRLARLQGGIDIRCLLAGQFTIDNPARGLGEAPFHLLLKGNCVIESGERRISLRPGDVVLFPRGDPHRVVADQATKAMATAEVAGVSFPTLRTQAEGADAPEPEVDLFCGRYRFAAGAGELLFGSLPDPLHVSFGADPSEPVRVLSALMRDEAQLDGLGTAAIMSSLCDALLAMVLRSGPGQRLSSGPLWTAVNDQDVLNVIDTVLNDPARHWTIAEFAGMASMSRATFVRHFDQATGMAVGEFLAKIRMMLAAEMLTESDRPVSAVAAAVGYRSESAFGRAFRLATATTPARFRRTARSLEEAGADQG
ncbi:MAG: AraC family transcriptional regulator, activator of mtrCDE [Microbacteriaceae bacterium]|nr:AraC family transcriptional regulator, activator of mtrCDE [Microbacteriaceae bacterium]